jgi:phosphate/phosphite/phosphonate ABC transporter binding protein
MKKLILFILILILITAGCNKETTINRPTPKENINKVPTINMKPLKMVYITGGSKTYMSEGLQMLAEYLTNKTGIPIEFTMLKKYPDAIKDFKEKKVDMGFLSGLIYITVKKDINIIPLVTSLNEGEASYVSFLVVRSDSGIKTLKDLKGKKFSFINKESTSGYLIPRVMFAEDGVKKPSEYFSKIEFSPDHLSSMIAVYNGYVDGGIVSKSVFTSKEAEKYIKDLHVVMKTEKIPQGCIVVRGDLEPDYVKKLKEALLEVGKTSDTIEIKRKLRIDGYVEAKDSDYKRIREIVKKNEELGDL